MISFLPLRISNPFSCLPSLPSFSPSLASVLCQILFSLWNKKLNRCHSPRVGGCPQGNMPSIPRCRFNLTTYAAKLSSRGVRWELSRRRRPVRQYAQCGAENTLLPLCLHSPKHLASHGPSHLVPDPRSPCSSCHATHWLLESCPELQKGSAYSPLSPRPIASYSSIYWMY